MNIQDQCLFKLFERAVDRGDFDHKSAAEEQEVFLRLLAVAQLVHLRHLNPGPSDLWAGILQTVKENLQTLMSTTNTLAAQLTTLQGDDQDILAALANLGTSMDEEFRQIDTDIANFQTMLDQQKGTIPDSLMADFGGLAASISARVKSLTDKTAALKSVDPGTGVPPPPPPSAPPAAPTNTPV